jgi:tetratricopeptide (TPR) repeat protein
MTLYSSTVQYRSTQVQYCTQVLVHHNYCHAFDRVLLHLLVKRLARKSGKPTTKTQSHQGPPQNQKNNMNQQVLNAAQLNQTGASCLAAYQLERAQKCFQIALESVALASQDVFIFDNQQQLEEQWALTLMTSQESFSRAIPRENEGFIYSKPFFFNPEATMTEEDIAPYGGVILFNLALTYHERSRFLGESSLRLALRMYDKCLTLLKNANSFDCSNVIIAALNNQAQIHEVLLDYRNASNRFKVLADFLHQADVRTDTLEPDDLRDIFHNIFFFKVPTCAAIA